MKEYNPKFRKLAEWDLVFSLRWHRWLPLYCFSVGAPTVWKFRVYRWQQTLLKLSWNAFNWRSSAIPTRVLPSQNRNSRHTRGQDDDDRGICKHLHAWRNCPDAAITGEKTVEESPSFCEYRLLHSHSNAFSVWAFSVWQMSLCSVSCYHVVRSRVNEHGFCI